MKHWPTTRDSLLVQLGDKDHQAAWAQFSEIYEPVIYRFGRRQRLQHDDAIELMQRVMIRVMKSAEAWLENDPPNQFRSWLRTVANNLLINMISRESKHRAEGGDAPQFDKPTYLSEEKEAILRLEAQRSVLRQAVKRIRQEFSSESFAAFEMTLLRSVSVEEAAQALKRSPGAIYAARARVVRRLKRETRMILNEIGEIE